MTVVTYDRRYLKDFIALNREWIETYFKVEPMDVAQLERAEETIVQKGGEIFFVLEGDRVLGTCAMVPHGPNAYELAKMAVTPEARGRGIGDVLMDAAESWAKAKRAKEVMLLSNTILEPAISLYRKHGYRVVNLGPHPDYERCNIEMSKTLWQQS